MAAATAGTRCYSARADRHCRLTLGGLRLARPPRETHDASSRARLLRSARCAAPHSGRTGSRWRAEASARSGSAAAAVPGARPIEDTALAGKLVRHTGQLKRIVDVIRVVGANAESGLATLIAPHIGVQGSEEGYRQQSRTARQSHRDRSSHSRATRSRGESFRTRCHAAPLRRHQPARPGPTQRPQAAPTPPPTLMNRP